MGISTRRVNRVGITATCLLSGLFASGVGVAQANTALPAGEQIMPGSVATAVTSSPVVGNMSSTQNLTIQLWLQPDQAGATAYANSVSDPHSASYHHYLSPAQYTARFGPSETTTTAVESWLRQQQFTHVVVDGQRNYVKATAPVSTVQNALQVQMKKYAVAGSTAPVTSNDRDVTLPASIAGDVVGISGLNNTQPTTMHAAPKPNAAQAAAEADNCSNFYGQHVQAGLPPLNGLTSFPTHICGYTGSQLRAAYGMNSANTGKGVTVAYVELGVPYKMFDTLTNWAAAGGLPAPKSANYTELSLSSGAQCSNPFDVEEQLDIESGYSMAPDQHELLVGGDSCNLQLEGLQPLFDADLAVLNGNGGHPLATIASNSWEASGETGPAEFANIAHSILLRAAGEGVGMYFSSGDGPGVLIPSSDPYALAVGGTSLAVDANDKRAFETGWSNDIEEVDTATNGYDDFGIATAAGGGTSLLWTQPSYQKGVVPQSMASPQAGDRSTLLRAVPDISALADLTTGISESVTEPGIDGGPDETSTFPEGGTSLASPLFAGMVAAAEQGRSASFGFINPLLYSLAGKSALHDILPVTNSTPAQYHGVYCADAACIGVPPSVWTFDAEAKDGTNQVSAKGYDTMTGVGTPNGQAFITALRQSKKS
jgi:subtilase family serine protease